MDFMKKQFDRAKQTVEEKFGDAPVTDYDSDVQDILSRSEELKAHTEKILSAVEIMVQPDPAIRLLPAFVNEINVNAQKEATKEGLNKAETVGQEMGHLAGKMTGTKLGTLLSAGESTFSKLGTSEREFLSEVQSKFSLPVKRFLREEVHILDTERKTLATRRLDMDSLKGKASKPDAPPEVAAELAKAEAAFKEQQETVRGVYKTKLEPAIAEVEKALRALAAAQIAHIDRQKAILGEMHKRI